MNTNKRHDVRVARRCRTTPEKLRAAANALELATQKAGPKDIVMYDFEEDLFFEYDPNSRTPADLLRDRVQVAGQAAHLPEKTN